MLSIAVCDDNEICLHELEASIADVFNHKKNEYTIASFTNGSELLCSGSYDIVILDIEMAGMDGLETARRLRERGDFCKLIFLTAYEKYALAAFDVEAIHYFMKPLDINKLKRVIDKIKQSLQETDQQFITVKHGSAFCKIMVKDILYIEVFDRKLFVHTLKNIYDYYEKLDCVEKELPYGFFRCHRSYIVNLAYVRRYDKMELTLRHGETVPVSKRKYGAFCTEFLRFLKKDGGNG